MAVQTQIQVRRGTASSWTSTNPTLAAGELGFETDTGKFKIGTGAATWTSLTYAGGGQNTLTTYQYTATSGQTTFSGVDSNGNTLSYTVGNIQVYLNGVLLVNTAEYTATSGTSIVLGTGAVTGDSLTVTSLGAFTVSSDIPKSTLTAKGSIVTATAGSTPANLSVGANGTVLTADSAETSGLKWATPSSGGMTLLSTTTLSGTSTTISAISGSYNNLMMIGINLSTSNQAGVWVKPNGATNCDYVGSLQVTSTRSNFGFNAAQLYFGLSEDLTANNANNNVVVTFFNYASTTANQKPLSMSCRLITGSAKTTVSAGGGVDTASAISSLEVGTNSGNLTGTVLLYGVK